LDEGLWDTIAARMDVSKRIGEWKKAHGVAPLQPERYENIVENLKLKVKRLGLSEKFAMQIWDMIHEESIKQQQ
jgi:chorismate mutase